MSADLPEIRKPDPQSPYALDVLAMLLADRRSENTRRAYRYDLNTFFQAAYGSEPTPECVGRFLALATPQMATMILRFKAQQITDGRSEATVNRRLAAILSLVRFARRVGATEADPGDHIDSEKVVAYRDTRGITRDQARQLLRLPDRATRKGRRDYALFLLLLENALRRSEVVGMTIGDFDPDARTLAIRGKGRGTQKERVTLSPTAVAAIRSYLEDSTHADRPDAPLFVNVSPACRGRALTADGLYKIVREYTGKAGLPVTLSPHRLRHTAITLALDAAGGDIRRVQRLSRHARLETLQIYDDNRADLQGEVTNLLSGILAAESSSP
jgi:integrase/recombinase XerC